MMRFNNDYFGSFGYPMFGYLGAFLIPLLIWSFAWKGWALWKAARKEDKVWFVVLLLVNTMGILDIIYIYIFNKRTFAKTSPAKKK